MTGTSDATRAGWPVPRLTPERVRSMQFARTPIGRRGLDEDEVALFLHRVAEDLAARDAAEASLRARLAHYRESLVRWQQDERDDPLDAADGLTAPGAAPSVEAVDILSRAQQEADAYVAQAEEYCRRLATDARQHASDVLSAARADAAAAAQAAVDELRGRAAGDAYAAEIEDLERRLAWARTFLASLETVEAQLRTAREALGYELARIDVPARVAQHQA